MNSEKFTTGAVAGALIFAFGMFNLWFWNIVPHDVMTTFTTDHALVVPIIAFATIGGIGVLYGTFSKSKSQ